MLQASLSCVWRPEPSTMFGHHLSEHHLFMILLDISQVFAFLSRAVSQMVDSLKREDRVSDSQTEPTWTFKIPGMILYPVCNNTSIELGTHLQKHLNLYTMYSISWAIACATLSWDTASQGEFSPTLSSCWPNTWPIGIQLAEPIEWQLWSIVEQDWSIIHFGFSVITT